MENESIGSYRLRVVEYYQHYVKQLCAAAGFLFSLLLFVLAVYAGKLIPFKWQHLYLYVIWIPVLLGGWLVYSKIFDRIESNKPKRVADEAGGRNWKTSRVDGSGPLKGS